MGRPPFLLRLYAFLTFPFAAEGSLVWWWRMHENRMTERHDSRCPFCGAEPPEAAS